MNIKPRDPFRSDNPFRKGDRVYRGENRTVQYNITRVHRDGTVTLNRYLTNVRYQELTAVNPS